MGVAQTNIRELNDVKNINHNVMLERYRTDIVFANRMVVSLQNDLNNLKSAETLILQKMNRDKKLTIIQTSYTVSRTSTIEPGQIVSASPDDALKGIDPRIAQAIAQLERDPHYQSLVKERDKIGAEILKVSRELQIQKKKLADIQDILKTLGDTVNSQMEKDGITKRLYTESYMLYEVHTKYRALTQNPDGTRFYSSDQPILGQTQRLITLFNAYSQRNAYVLSGDLLLDYDDPGSDYNEKALTQLLERVRQVYTVPEEVTNDRQKKYSAQLLTQLMDPFVSQEVKRESDTPRVATSNNSLNNVLNTPAKAINKFMDIITLGSLKVLMSWTGESQAQALTDGFNKFISGLNGGKPLCNAPPPTPQQVAVAAQDAAQKVAEKQGGQQVSQDFAKAVVKQSNDLITIPNFGVNLQLNINDKSKVNFFAPIGKITHIWDSQRTLDTYFGPATSLYQYNILKAAESLNGSLINYNDKTVDFYSLEIIRMLKGVTPPFTVNVDHYTKAADYTWQGDKED